MHCLKTTISIGLDTPFRALHLSDSHICRADQRENQRKLTLAKNRAESFDNGIPGRTEDYFRAQLAYADEQRLPILYTGDFCDFVSYANLEYMRDTLFARDCFMAAGNHEYSLYVGEAFEDEAYKMQSYDLVQSYCRNDLRFASRVMGGINFVAVDDVYYDFTPVQLTQMKAEVAKGLPIVLIMHNPLYTPDLAKFMIEDNDLPCAYLTGAPDELVNTFPEDRRIQQKSHPDTLAFIDYIYSQPLIRAVLAGHLHHSRETRLPSGIMQYVTGGGYNGCARDITFE